MLQKVEPDEDGQPLALPSDAPAPAPPERRVLARIARAAIQAILMIAIIAGAAKIADIMIKSAPETKKRPAFKTVYTIDTVRAVRADNQPTFVSYGQIVAARNVDLRALVSGEIVSVSRNLQSGAAIREGDTLVEIDRFNYQGALQEAKANLDEAKAKRSENEARITLERSKLESAKEQLAFATADLERVKKLKQRGTSTQQQLEARNLIVSQRKQALAISTDTIKIEQSRLVQMDATIARLQWRVDQAQRNLDNAILVAPFSGIVRSSAAEVGRLVSANDVVVSMYEADSLEAKFTLTDSQYGRLQASEAGLVGRKVNVVWTVGGERFSWPARIDRLGAEIASNRGGVELFAQLDRSDNPVAIRPGAFVEVSVPDKIFRDTIAVPDTAIYGSDTIYVAIDGKLVERKVRVAAYDGATVLISTGIEPGEAVLTTRITEVSEGLSVVTEPGSAEQGNRANLEPGVGRPSEPEMKKILSANKLEPEEFRALPDDEKRKLIADWRKANPAVTN